jgi:hypothetical protein
MKYLGDYAEDYATLNFKFSTHKADGTPITLAGSPVVKVYKGSATDSETATGVTLVVDFDSVTGLHNVLIDLSADAFYAVGNDYSVVITTGTVDGVSVVGTVLATFSIENRFAEVDLTKIAGAAVNTSAAQLGVNAVQIGATAQTGRDIGASVLLSSGSGAGQLDFTSGVVKSNLSQILGTALTETAGYLTAGFKKFFNVATPALTVASVDQTGDSYARLGAPTGASVSADIAAVKSQTAAIETDTQDLQTQVGTDGAGLTALGDARLANLDAAISSRSTLTAQNVWEYATRTLSSFGTLVADAATAVWGAATRTLSAFGFTVAATVADKSGYSLDAAYDAAKTAAPASTALSTAVWTGTKAGYLDAAVTSRSTLATGDIPTALQNADALLSRVLAAESYAADGAVPTLSQVLYMILNGLTQFSITNTTLTVYKLDGVTPAMTFTLDSASEPTSRVRAS